jgi:hypothetical protein
VAIEKLKAEFIQAAAGNEAASIAKISGLTNKSVILVGERAFRERWSDFSCCCTRCNQAVQSWRGFHVALVNVAHLKPAQLEIFCQVDDQSQIQQARSIFKPPGA